MCLDVHNEGGSAYLLADSSLSVCLCVMRSIF